ncbi:MAG: flagellar basal body protein FliL [Treponema sp.]|nr:flagellar basal body protein FliL [Treponema sp.]
MSDVELDDIEGGEAAEPSKGSKKKGGKLGNLLPTILKFVAIGLGATIFIITVSLITSNIVMSRGSSQTVISDPSSPYIGKRPAYSYYENLGSITVRTADFPANVSVTVDMIIGFDLNDVTVSSELITRRFELRDFIRRYFSQKTAVELAPEREESLKAEIREMLNTRFLDSRGARLILFDRLNVMESSF